MEYINSMRKQNESVRSPLKSFQSLQSFKLSPHERAQVYHNAVNIPQFLVDNLKSEHRVIKEFTGQDAILKAFYFNLMKLAYELQNEETNYTQLVEQILIGQQEFGMGELQDKNFSDKQYRSFLREFLEILQNQEIPNFEATVECYPIIDQILAKMFKQLVPFTLKLKDCADFDMAKRIFQFLAKKFKIKLQIISGCFKFIESDIFIYVGNFTQIYLIFMDQLAFIREVTEEATSQSHTSRSNTSMSNSYRKAEKVMSKTEIQNRDNKEQSEKKVFTTVINMLDSKKSPQSSSKLSSSIRCRNSLEQDLDRQNMFERGSDRITQKDKSSVQEYYDTSSINPKPQNSSSMSSFKTQNPSKYLEQYQTCPVINQQSDRFASPSSRQAIERHSKNTSQLSSSSSSNVNQSPSRFQIVRDSLAPKPILVKAQTYTENNQNRYQRYVATFTPSNFESKLKQSGSKDKNLTASEGFYQPRQSKYSPDMFKKPGMEPVSSKFSSHLNKNSNLEIFSDIKEQPNNFQPKSTKFQHLSSKGFSKNQTKNDDNSYQKFTDSGLLQVLDEEYRDRIKSIKQKYREKRSKIQTGV